LATFDPTREIAACVARKPDIAVERA